MPLPLGWNGFSEVIGRHSFDLDAGDGFFFAVFHNNAVGKSLGGTRIDNNGGIGCAGRLDGFHIQVVAMLMRNQDQVRFGKRRIVRVHRYRIRVNDFPGVGQHQRAVPDKGYLQIAAGGLE